MSKASNLIALFFICFLFFPYLLLGIHLPQFSLPEWGEVLWAIKNAGLQAGISALLTLLLALFFSLGFCYWVNLLSGKKSLRKLIPALELIVLLPTFLPALFIILIVMATVSPFPIGSIGVIFIHILLNTGLATLLISQIIYRKLIPLLELAAIEGASRGKFIKNSFGWIWKDLFAVLIFLFILVFANFSVPFVAGGGKATTLEILIYEKIRISGDWGQALSLAFIQLILLAGFSLFNPQFKSPLSSRSEQVHLLQSPFAAICLLIFSLAPIFIFIFQSIGAWEKVFNIPGLWQAAQSTLMMSVLFSLSVGFLVLIFLVITAYLDIRSFLHRLLISIISPSTALVGFSLLFFISDQEPWISMKWILGFTYLIFTTLYRWGWRQALTDLDQQILVAQSLGASPFLIYTRIKLPQLIMPACQIAGIASLWAIGDFALGKILLAEDITLSLLIQTLMSSYRTEAALALMNLLMLLGVFSYLIFLGVGYVGRRTSTQDI